MAFIWGMLSSSGKMTYTSGSFFLNFILVSILFVLIFYLLQGVIFLYRVVRNSILNDFRVFLFMLNVFWNKKLNDILPKIYRWVRKIHGKYHVPTEKNPHFLRESRVTSGMKIPIEDFIKTNNLVYLTLPEKYKHNLAYYLFGEKEHSFKTLDRKKQNILLIFLMQGFELTGETYKLRLLELITQDLTCGFTLLAYPCSNQEKLTTEKGKTFSITSSDFLQAVETDVIHFKETFKFNDQSEEYVYLHLRFEAVAFFLLHHKIDMDAFMGDEANGEIFTTLMKSTESYTNLQEMLFLLERTFGKKFPD